MTDSDEARAAADRVLEAVRAAVRLLEAVPDAGVRAQAAGLVLREWRAQQWLPKEIRQQAVNTLNEGGMDFPEIGELLDVDRSRAWRIAKGL